METNDLDIIRICGVGDLWVLEDYTWEFDDIMIIIPENVVTRLTTDAMNKVISYIETFEAEAVHNGFTKVEDEDDTFYHDHVRRYIREV